MTKSSDGNDSPGAKDVAGGVTVLATDTGRGTGRRRAIRRAGPPKGDASQAADAYETVVSTAVVSAREPAQTIPKTSVSSSTTRPADTETSSGIQQPNRRRRRLAVAATAVVIVGLIAVCGLFVYANGRADDRLAKQNEYILAARQVALNLTSIQVDTAKQTIEQILDNSTGQFREEFDGRIDPFVSVVETANVDAEGEIIESGLESQNGDDAQVLVAARSMVTNGDSETPQARDFRLRITVTDQGGRMLISKVEFVA